MARQVKWQHVEHDGWLHVCHEGACELCIPETVRYNVQHDILGNYDRCFVEAAGWGDDPVVTAYWTLDGEQSPMSNAIALGRDVTLEVPEPSQSQMYAAALIAFALVRGLKRRKHGAG
jgi:hypothetical protein